MDSLEEVFDEVISKESMYTSLLVSQKYGVPRDVMRTCMKNKFSKQWCRSMHPIVLATYNHMFKHNKMILDFGGCTTTFQNVAHYKSTYNQRMRLYRMCMLEVFTRASTNYQAVGHKVGNIVCSTVEVISLAYAYEIHVCAIKVCILGGKFNKNCNTSIQSMFRCPVVYIHCEPLFFKVVGHVGTEGPIWYAGYNPCRYLRCLLGCTFCGNVKYYLRLITVNLEAPIYLEILSGGLPTSLYKIGGDTSLTLTIPP